MRRFLMALLFVVFLLACITEAMAATRYISHNGSGTTCSSDIPCSFATARNLSAPGDNIIAKPGTYTGGTATSYPFQWNGKHGTAEKPITFKSEVQGGAILDGRYINNIVMSFIDCSYIVIDGFEIKRGINNGIVMAGYKNSAGTDYDYTHHITIKNCEIHSQNSLYTGACDVGGVMCGVALNAATHNCVFENNYIHDNGKASGSCTAATVSHLSRHDQGIYLKGKAHTIRNNTFANHVRGWGIKVDGYCNKTLLTVGEYGALIEGNRFNPEVRSDLTSSGSIAFFVNQVAENGSGDGCIMGAGDPTRTPIGTKMFQNEPKNVMIRNNKFYHALDTYFLRQQGTPSYAFCTIFENTMIQNNITTGSRVSSDEQYANVAASLVMSGNIFNADESYFEDVPVVPPDEEEIPPYAPARMKISATGRACPLGSGVKMEITK